MTPYATPYQISKSPHPNPLPEGEGTRKQNVGQSNLSKTGYKLSSASYRAVVAIRSPANLRSVPVARGHARTERDCPKPRL